MTGWVTLCCRCRRREWRRRSACSSTTCNLYTYGIVLLVSVAWLLLTATKQISNTRPQGCSGPRTCLSTPTRFVCCDAGILHVATKILVPGSRRCDPHNGGLVWGRKWHCGVAVAWGSCPEVRTVGMFAAQILYSLQHPKSRHMYAKYAFTFHSIYSGLPRRIGTVTDNFLCMYLTKCFRTEFATTNVKSASCFPCGHGS